MARGQALPCRTLFSMVFPAQAALLREAIANYRMLRRLLRAWETETVKLIEADTEDQ
jgi:hypothetical protein